MLKHAKREVNNSYFAFVSDVCHENLRFVHFKIEMTKFSRCGVTQFSQVQSIKKSYVSLG